MKLAFLAGLLGLASVAAAAEDSTEVLRRGAYLFRAGLCTGCHTDTAGGGPLLAGGRPLKTDFGTFYGPNITPDGRRLGRWSWDDFWRAMRQGVSPEGRPYFPAFPYPSFAKIADEDLWALWAYLRTLPASPRANTEHELRAPFGWRVLLWPWRWLYFDPAPFRPDPRARAEVDRGRYLVQALGHCGECHTPRNALGARKAGWDLAGTAAGPEGGRVPNLTPDPATGLGSWSATDIAEYLRSGMTPQGDFAGGGMGEVVEEGTRHLTEGDRRAVAAYLRTLAAIRNPAVAPKRAPRKDPEW